MDSVDLSRSTGIIEVLVPLIEDASELPKVPPYPGGPVIPWHTLPMDGPSPIIAIDIVSRDLGDGLSFECGLILRLDGSPDVSIVTSEEIPGTLEVRVLGRR